MGKWFNPVERPAGRGEAGGSNPPLSIIYKKQTEFQDFMPL